MYQCDREEAVMTEKNKDLWQKVRDAQKTAYAVQREVAQAPSDELDPLLSKAAAECTEFLHKTNRLVAPIAALEIVTAVRKKATNEQVGEWLLGMIEARAMDAFEHEEELGTVNALWPLIESELGLYFEVV